MTRTRMLIGLISISILLAACGGKSEVSVPLTYKVTGDADEAAVVYTSETGGKEKTAVTPPWETSFSVGGSFGFDLRVENSGQTGSVGCEVWINGRQVGAVSGQQSAACFGSFTSDGDTSSTSFFSNSEDFDTAVVENTAVTPTPEPTIPPTEEPEPPQSNTVVSAAETTPADIKAASVTETAALSDIFGLNNVAWSPDGAQLATSEKSGVQLWQFAPDDAAPLQKLRLLSAPTEMRIESLAWSPDGAAVIGGSMDGVWVWDAASGELITELPHEYGARSFTWSPDGRTLASSSNDGRVRLWDAANNWQLTGTLTEIQDTIREVAWSPDGALIATTEQYVVHLWDAASGEEVRTLEGHTDLVGNLAWSPDGQRLATTSDDQTVRIWDAAAGSEQLVLEHASYITDIAWSPDGVILAAGTGDDEIYLWNAQSGDDLLTFTGLSDSVTELDWSGDGAYLAAASLYASEARVWRVTPLESEAEPSTAEETAVPPAANSDNFTPFTSPDGALSFRHPPDWEIEDISDNRLTGFIIAPDDDGVRMFRGVTPPGDNALVLVSTFLDNQVADQTLSELHTDLVDDFYDLLSLKSLNEPTAYTGDGVNRIWQDFVGTLGDGSQIHYIFTVYGNDKTAWYAIAGIFAADGAELETAVNAILESVVVP